MERIRWNILIMAYVAFSPMVISAEQTVSRARVQKVILISVDTLRADFLGCYNSKMKTSPNLDQFAAENVICLNDLAQAATTAPSHKSIFYSVYPSIHKTSIHSVPQERLMSPVEIMRTNGFETAAFTGGGQISRSFGFARGFDSYWEPSSHEDLKHELNEIRRLSFDWLDKHYSKQFFLFLHTFEVHCPYDPPAPFFKKWSAWYGGLIKKDKCHPDFYLPYRRMSEIDYSYIRSLYSAEVNYVDDFLGSLFKKLKDLGIYDRTLIVFLSDHGESLGERRYIGHSQLYEVQLHVPLILHVPGISAKRISAPIESLDVMATIFELLGIKNSSFPFQGKSLMPLIRNPAIFDSARARISEERGRVRVRIGNLALNFSPDGKNQEELYDLKNDPEETENIADANPKTVEKMKISYFKMIAGSKDLSAQFILNPEKKPAVGEETIEQLKSLGYVAQ